MVNDYNVKVETIFVRHDGTASFETFNTVRAGVVVADNQLRTLYFDQCHCRLFHMFLSVGEDYPAGRSAASTRCFFSKSGLPLTKDRLLLVCRMSSATMSTSVQVEPVMETRYSGVGRCKCSFWFAVAHDILGVFIMMVGVFGGLVIHDLCIYVGAIIIFLSLIWWVFWYSGNIDVPPEELEDDVGLIKLKNHQLSQMVRRMSNRLSSRIRDSFRKNVRPTREGPAFNSRPSNTGTEVSLYDITIA